MNEKDLRKLISQREGLRIDFKRDLRRETMDDLSNDFAAFANTDGGQIIIGVTNDKKIIGVEDYSEKASDIYQRASTCKPRVDIRVSEEKLDGCDLILIQISKSNWIHADNRQRFPQRVGDKTDFMEIGAILSSAKALGLISGEAGEMYPAQTRRTPKKGHKFLVSLLSDKNPVVRREAMKDLVGHAGTVRIENIPRLLPLLLSLFEDRDVEIRSSAVSLVERLQYYLNPKLPLAMSLFDKYAHVSLNDEDYENRRKAMLLVVNSGDPRCVEVIHEFLTKSTKETYDKIKPDREALRVIIEKGLGYNLRTMLYQELTRRHNKEIKERILVFLNHLRGVYWPI